MNPCLFYNNFSYKLTKQKVNKTRSEQESHPPNGHCVVADQHSPDELGLDAFVDQGLLKIRKLELVDEADVVAWSLFVE